MSASGTKRTWRCCTCPLSGIKRTGSRDRGSLSALSPKADMCSTQADVRFVPEADIRHLSTSRSIGRSDGVPVGRRNLTHHSADIYSPVVSQSRYQVNHPLPTTGNSPGRFDVFSAVFNHRRSNMMKFPSTFDEESVLTYEVCDEALEIAGGK